jgi:hypothetical protein
LRASALAEEKTIVRPSGDHTGHASAALSLVNCRSPDPSTCWTQMSALPVAVETKATRAPSGESEECITASPAIVVSCRGGIAPDKGNSHRFRLPACALLKSSVCPSLVT